MLANYILGAQNSYVQRIRCHRIVLQSCEMYFLGYFLFLDYQ